MGVMPWIGGDYTEKCHTENLRTRKIPGTGKFVGRSKFLNGVNKPGFFSLQEPITATALMARRPPNTTGIQVVLNQGSDQFRSIQTPRQGGVARLTSNSARIGERPK